jgi:hypothetical protein
MRTITLPFLLTLGAGLGACGGPDDEPVPPRATWYQDVAPILSKHCDSCHREGGIGPFPLTDFATAKVNSGRMLQQVEAGTMPPFDAREESGCTPRFGWTDDPRLPADEKATLQAWIEDGHALGQEAAIAPPRSEQLTDVSRTLVPEIGFATSGDRDQFICYILDPGVTQPVAWLNGLQVRPDLTEVVHHAVISEVVAGKPQDDLVALHGIGKAFDCGTATQPGNFVVHIWTPGNQPMQTSSEIAVPITAGAKLVMQIHYHPAGKSHAADKTALDLRFTSVWPRKMYFVAAAGNAASAPQLLPGPGDGAAPAFKIPANVADHPEHMRIPWPVINNPDVRIFSVNPHMHLIGTHISATIERPAARGADPQTECLANGNWNFDWQRTYAYNTSLDSLPSVKAGDVIDIKCQWNNTLANPFVQRMLADNNLPMIPIDVLLGEQTSNEMCLEIFGIAINAPARPATVDAPFSIPALPDLQGLAPGVSLLRSL